MMDVGLLHRRLAGLLLIGFCVTASQAREATMRQLMGMSLSDLINIQITSATKRPQRAREIPATVYVFTEQDFDRYGFRDIKDVLKYVPGVEYGYPHSWLQGGQRGFSNTWSQTKLLIDGRDATHANSASPYFQHQYPLFNVKRVEVIQGPGSSLYGADAFVGIINIVTKNAQNTDSASEVGLSLEAGKDDQESQQINISKIVKEQSWGVALHGSLLNKQDPDFDDFVASTKFSALNVASRNSFLNSGYPYKDDNRGYMASVEGYYEMDKQLWQLGVEYRGSRDGGGIENPELIFSNFKDTQDKYRLFVDYTFSFSNDTKLLVSTQHKKERVVYDFNLRDDSLGLPPPFLTFEQSWNRTHEVGAQLSHDFKMLKNYLIVGIDYEDNQLTSPEFELSQFEAVEPFWENLVRSFYIQDQQYLFDDRVLITLGARYDDGDHYGHVKNIRGGSHFFINEQLTFKILYGEAFKEATPFELSTNNSLNPAEIETSELVIDYRHSENLTSQFNYYHSKASDIVREDRQANDGISRNIGAKEVDGLEAYFRWQYGQYQGFFWADFVEETDDLDVAEYKYGFGINRQIADHWQLGLVGKYVGPIETEAFDSSSNRRIIRVSPYKILDLTLSTDDLMSFDEGSGYLSRSLGMSVSIYNLLDRDNFYPNVRGPDPIQFLDAGRRVTVSFTLSF